MSFASDTRTRLEPLVALLLPGALVGAALGWDAGAAAAGLAVFASLLAVVAVAGRAMERLE